MSSKRSTPDEQRQRLIKLVHIAKGQLEMAEDSYRAILANEGDGKTSSSDLTIQQLERVLDHMKRCGFKVRSKAKPKGATRPAKAQPSRPLARDPETKKIRALWLFLHDLGAVNNPSEEALAKYQKRITKVDDLHWINGAQAETLIESMKKWAMRFLPDATRALAKQVAADIESGRLQLAPEDTGQLSILVQVAQQRMTFDPMHAAFDALSHAARKAAS